jgi:hypothetical protein
MCWWKWNPALSGYALSLKACCNVNFLFVIAAANNFQSGKLDGWVFSSSHVLSQQWSEGSRIKVHDFPLQEKKRQMCWSTLTNKLAPKYFPAQPYPIFLDFYFPSCAQAEFSSPYQDLVGDLLVPALSLSHHEDAQLHLSLFPRLCC